jgi:putative tryptophan/tyrosine transport system substrate-binding protein
VLKNRSRLLIFVILISLLRGLAWAGPEIVAVQSMRIQPYEDAVQGFETASGAQMRRLILAESKGMDFEKRIREIRPDLILAIGPDALSRCVKIKDIPVIYLMVLNPLSLLSGEKNISGISMDVPPEKQLRALLDALPQTKTIGLLYTREKTGRLADKAREAARETGIKLLAKEVRSTRDVPQAIQDMKGKIDAFWMLPDLTVITPETIEFLLLFSLENGIPILAFSEKYVELGAFLSVGIDAFDIGVQAGEMAEKILAGGGIPAQPADARKAVVSINLKAARQLRITVDEKIIRNARIIN